MKEISFYNEGTEIPSFFSEDLTLRWFDKIADDYEVELGELSFIFCNDDYILDVNQKYLEHDYYTDVITFDYSEDDVLSGDIFISVDTVRSNSELFKTDMEEEFNRVLCHSLLHLIGFKDKMPEEEQEMRQNEDKCLNLLKTIKK